MASLSPNSRPDADAASQGLPCTEGSNKVQTSVISESNPSTQTSAPAETAEAKGSLQLGTEKPSSPSRQTRHQHSQQQKEKHQNHKLSDYIYDPKSTQQSPAPQITIPETTPPTDKHSSQNPDSSQQRVSKKTDKQKKPKKQTKSNPYVYSSTNQSNIELQQEEPPKPKEHVKPVDDAPSPAKPNTRGKGKKTSNDKYGIYVPHYEDPTPKPAEKLKQSEQSSGSSQQTESKDHTPVSTTDQKSQGKKKAPKKKGQGKSQNQNQYVYKPSEPQQSDPQPAPAKHRKGKTHEPKAHRAPQPEPEPEYVTRTLKRAPRGDIPPDPEPLHPEPVPEPAAEPDYSPNWSENPREDTRYGNGRRQHMPQRAPRPSYNDEQRSQYQKPRQYDQENPRYYHHDDFGQNGFSSNQRAGYNRVHPIIKSNQIEYHQTNDPTQHWLKAANVMSPADREKQIALYQREIDIEQQAQYQSQQVELQLDEARKNVEQNSAKIHSLKFEIAQHQQNAKQRAHDLSNLKRRMRANEDQEIAKIEEEFARKQAALTDIIAGEATTPETVTDSDLSDTEQRKAEHLRAQQEKARRVNDGTREDPRFAQLTHDKKHAMMKHSQEFKARLKDQEAPIEAAIREAENEARAKQRLIEKLEAENRQYIQFEKTAPAPRVPNDLSLQIERLAVFQKVHEEWLSASQNQHIHIEPFEDTPKQPFSIAFPSGHAIPAIEVKPPASSPIKITKRSETKPPIIRPGITRDSEPDMFWPQPSEPVHPTVPAIEEEEIDDEIEEPAIGPAVTNMQAKKAWQGFHVRTVDKVVKEEKPDVESITVTAIALRSDAAAPIEQEEAHLEVLVGEELPDLVTPVKHEAVIPEEMQFHIEDVDPESHETETRSRSPSPIAEEPKEEPPVEELPTDDKGDEKSKQDCLVQ